MAYTPERIPVPKQFSHLGEEWIASATGTGHGVGFGNAIPAIDRWGVIFRSLTNPARGEYRASISASDPANATDVELKQALEEQLILAAIDRSRYIWRPAEAIARDTGLETERVRQYLENAAPDIIVGDRNAQGLWLYTTGEHLAKSTGDVMKRFYEVEESS
jgi:hypothetical protein